MFVVDFGSENSLNVFYACTDICLTMKIFPKQIAFQKAFLQYGSMFFSFCLSLSMLRFFSLSLKSIIANYSLPKNGRRIFVLLFHAIYSTVSAD